MKFPQMLIAFALVLPAAAATSEPVRLKFSARTAASLYGFNVYRAEQREGPFVRINAQVVTKAVDDAPAAEKRFEYDDATAQAGKTYYYYVDSVDRSGHKRRLTGVLSKTAGGG